MRPLSTQRSGPQPGWKRRGGGRLTFPPREDAESWERARAAEPRGHRVAKGSCVDKKTYPLEMKPAPVSAIHLEQPSLLHAGDSFRTFCGQKWPPDHVPHRLGAAERHSKSAQGVKHVPSSSPAASKTQQGWKIKANEDEVWGTQDPTGKHSFPKISSEGRSLPSATRSHMACAILIPVPSTPTLIWCITCKWRQRDATAVTDYRVLLYKVHCLQVLPLNFKLIIRGTTSSEANSKKTPSC